MKRITTHIRNAVLKGGILLLGEEKPPPLTCTEGYITDMIPDMLIEQKETFGPLVCIGKFTAMEETIDRANNNGYGLGAVLFGDAQAEFVADQLVAGIVGINQGVGGESDPPWADQKLAVSVFTDHPTATNSLPRYTSSQPLKPQ